MELLKKYITEKGTVKEEKYLLVDTFINQLIDTKLLDNAACQFVEYFKDFDIDKIITIEAAGIVPALLVANKLGLDLLILRKGQSATLISTYEAEIHSFTKGTITKISCNRENLNKGEKCLFIDDFLASGEAFKGVLDLVKQAEAELVGVGILVEKSHQGGVNVIKETNIPLYSLARVKSLKNNEVQWED